MALEVDKRWRILQHNAAMAAYRVRITHEKVGLSLFRKKWLRKSTLTQKIEMLFMKN